MSASIWKFPLEITDHQIVNTPGKAGMLSVQFQGGQLCLWVLIADTKCDQNEEADIYVFGTGNPLPPVNDLVFIGTVQQLGGRLIWHVFYKTRQP